MHTGTQHASASDAVSRVLEEEQRQETALADARRQAGALIDAARSRARRIEALADERLRRVRASGDRLLERRLEEIAQRFEIEAQQVQATLPDTAAWEQATRDTARRIIGIAPQQAADSGPADERA